MIKALMWFYKGCWLDMVDLTMCDAREVQKLVESYCKVENIQVQEIFAYLLHANIPA